MIHKCKMCGGTLNVSEGSTVCECEYCGSVQTIPAIDEDKKGKLYDRANRLRFNNEFDKAETLYEQIVSEYPNEAEAYWGIILSKYGIEYVDDPVTGDKIPTCHRSSFSSVMDDPDFEMVMENSDFISRPIYRTQAKQIEEIRKSIIEVSSKEDPYDIFICYKENAENGQRTIDSVLAQDVYDALTDKGYKVFFSRISLEDKIGKEYEPYIFAALNSAKVMLAFGTSYDNYNAPWVKNEWSRFLKLMTQDKSKHLIPCFRDIDVYDMPKEFVRLQSQDLGKVGAIQDLLRGIDKLLGKNNKNEQVTVNKPQSENGNSNVVKVEDTRRNSDIGVNNNNRKSNNKILYICTILAVAVVAVILMMNVVGSNNKLETVVPVGEHIEMVSVPKLDGKTVNEAENILEGMGLYVSEYCYVDSDEYDKGLVVETIPNQNASVEKNTGVALYISDPQTNGNGNMNALYQIEISSVGAGVSIRPEPSVSEGNNAIWETFPYEVYNVYEVINKDGYTWYRVGESAWLPSDGTWVYETYGKSDVRSIGTYTIENLDENMNIYDCPRIDGNRIGKAEYLGKYSVSNSFYDGEYTWFEIGSRNWVKQTFKKQRLNIYY